MEQGGKAEEGSVQAQVVGLESGLGQVVERRGWWEKRDSLRMDSRRGNYAATGQSF